MFSSLRYCTVITALLSLAGCATTIDDGTDFMVVPPARSTTQMEIESAVAELISTYPVCEALESLKFVGRPSVNFDPRSRVAPFDRDTEETLDVFVRLGYLTKTPRPEFGQRAFKFDRTVLGKDAEVLDSRGFCFPAERKLVAITNIERSAKVGSDRYLIVDFTHIQNPMSVWAREPTLVRIAGGRGLSSEQFVGRVLLSRVWLRKEHPLKGAPHSGALWAVSYDHVHHRWEGGKWGSVTLRPWGLNPH